MRERERERERERGQNEWDKLRYGRVHEFCES